MSDKPAIWDAVQWEILPKPEGDDSELPYATHRGFINIMGKQLECYQLSNGQRIFTADSVEEFFVARPVTKAYQPVVETQ